MLLEWRHVWGLQWMICQRMAMSPAATRGHCVDTLQPAMEPDRKKKKRKQKTKTPLHLLKYPQPGDGRSFLILNRINILVNFRFHLDSNRRKALQPSILNVSGEAEEHANTACFWCAGTWRAFWFHMRSSLHAASGLLLFLEKWRL